MSLPEESIRELTSLAGVALGQEDIRTTLTEICRIAVRAIPNAVAVSMTSLGQSGQGAVASSDEWAKSLDEMQHEEREGPCLDAARTGVAFRVRDMGVEARWPSYMPRAVQRGARSMMSLPLSTENKPTGALNVYSREPDAFGPMEFSIAEIIAGHANLASQTAATLFAHKELSEQLRQAMTSRAVIEQAKGILMAGQRCTADDAFTTLVALSQASNRKLRDVAQAVVDTGSIEG